MLTEEDMDQITAQGLSREIIYRQINRFKEGFPSLNIHRAALINDGILRMKPQEVWELSKSFDTRKRGRHIIKFVPASGAATRMFKSLYEYVEQNSTHPEVESILKQTHRFAFASDLMKKLDGKPVQEDPQGAISTLIHPSGLGYGSLPKALIPFHKYDEGSRTALEEHLSEGALYAAETGSIARIHFTVSPEHREAFEQHVSQVLPLYETKYKIKYEISYSQQKKSTDTIAVTPDNQPFREENGSLLFRPAGHGALLENLNDLNADLIYIKTIDNVVPDIHKEDTILYKKALGGLLLSLQEQTFEYLKHLDEELNPSESLMEEICHFFETKLCGKLPKRYTSLKKQEQIELLKKLLNRPLRICGMVKNEGEPGGGPFWVMDKEGNESLQIAESSQISESQKHLMKNATHFNPVDLVCGTKDYRGKKFNLKEFVDHATGFISLKSKNGRELKAQELPGLWNGAMANWNTIFVEVPISTFSPVKSVGDLLRPQHQCK